MNYHSQLNSFHLNTHCIAHNCLLFYTVSYQVSKFHSTCKILVYTHNILLKNISRIYFHTFIHIDLPNNLIRIGYRLILINMINSCLLDILYTHLKSPSSNQIYTQCMAEMLNNLYSLTGIEYTLRSLSSIHPNKTVSHSMYTSLPQWDTLCTFLLTGTDSTLIYMFSIVVIYFTE